MKTQPISALQHGAQYAYKRGCRCLSCRAWKAEDMARYRRMNPTRTRGQRKSAAIRARSQRKVG